MRLQRCSIWHSAVGRRSLRISWTSTKNVCFCKRDQRMFVSAITISGQPDVSLDISADVSLCSRHHRGQPKLILVPLLPHCADSIGGNGQANSSHTTPFISIGF